MNMHSIPKLTLLAAAMISSPATIAEATAGSDRAASAQVSTLATEQEAAKAGTHVQIVPFDSDSVTLSDNASQRLDNLVQVLDKDKPAKVTVKLEPSEVAQAGTDDGRIFSDNESSADANLADSSGANQTVGTEAADYERRAQASAQLDREMQASADLISKHRAERVKQYLQDRGVQVSEFNVTDSAYQSEAAIEQAESAKENVQEVLIVIGAAN